MFPEHSTDEIIATKLILKLEIDVGKRGTGLEIMYILCFLDIERIQL